ncbi:MAG: hypothetical protein K6E32_05665 [Lachnospiraceae bacterium]|nr:hypothetical protein [Lachnospiraceae bacterium]
MNFTALKTTLNNIESDLEENIKSAIAERHSEIADYLCKRLTLENQWYWDEDYDEGIEVEKADISYIEVKNFDLDNIELDDNISENDCEGQVTVRIEANNIEGLAELPFEIYFDGDEANDLRQLRGDKYTNYKKFLQKEYDCPDYEECTVATLDSYEFEATISFTYEDGEFSIDVDYDVDLDELVAKLMAKH